MRPAHRTQAPLIVAAVGLLAALALLAAMFLNAEMLVRLGIWGSIWFVLLLLLGLMAAVCLFTLFKSYARYSGKVFDWPIEISGPAALMVIVIVLGFKFAPNPSSKFDMTIFLHGEEGQNAVVLHNKGVLSLDFGADRRDAAIGSKGEARFIGIPAEWRGRSVPVILDADGYELSNPNTNVTLDKEARYLVVRSKPLHVSGEVLDSYGRPLAGAHLRLKDKTSITDNDGHFDMLVPSDLAVQDSTLSITAPKHRPWRGQVTPGSNPLVVRLESDNK